MTPTRTRHRHEHRAPVAIAVLVNLGLSLFLPSEVLFFPSWVVPVLGVLLLIPLVVFNPRRLTRDTTWSRWVSFSLAILLTVANQLTVVRTIELLLGGHADGGAVLLTALQVWVSTIIAFGLVYWELDRAGRWLVVVPSCGQVTRPTSSSPRRPTRRPPRGVRSTSTTSTSR
ncbi:hypothetical protein QP157_03970 [Sphingomonas sp. LR61]|uniref:hypothetical protein n=1 Tax=Sphingomonas sp. LR61 TaxID=3050234 RepID=UPI002FE03D2E